MRRSSSTMSLWVCVAALLARTALAASDAPYSYSIDNVDIFSMDHRVTVFSHSMLIDHEVSVRDPILSSAQLRSIRDEWASLLDEEARKDLESYEEEENRFAWRNIAFLGFFGGNDKNLTTNVETLASLKRLRITEDTASKMIGHFVYVASNMALSTMRCNISNIDNRASFAGDLLRFSQIEGSIELGDGQTVAYRVLGETGQCISTIRQQYIGAYCTIEANPSPTQPTTQATTTSTTEPPSSGTEAPLPTRSSGASGAQTHCLYTLAACLLPALTLQGIFQS